MIAGNAIGGQLFDSWGPDLPIQLALLILPLTFLLLLFAHEAVSITSSTLENTELPETMSRQQATKFMTISWLANIGGTFCMSIVVFLLPDLAVEVGMTPGLQGKMFALCRVVVIVTYLIMYASHKWHFRFVGVLASQTLAIAGLFLLANANGQKDLFLGTSALAVLLGYNYFAGLYYSVAYSTTECRGRWCGIHEATLGIGLTLGSVLGGWIGIYDGVRASFVLAALVISGLLAMQVIIWLRVNVSNAEITTVVPATNRNR